MKHVTFIDKLDVSGEEKRWRSSPVWFGGERERESKVGRLKTIVVRGKVAFKPTNGKES